MDQISIKQTGSNQNYRQPMAQEICAYLDSIGLEHKTVGENIQVRECPSCPPDTSDSSNQWKLGIRKADGVYNCFRCNDKGPWSVFTAIAGYNRPSIPRDIKTQSYSNDEYHKKIWEESLPLEHQDAEPARHYFRARGLDHFTSDSFRMHPRLMHSDGSGVRTGPYPTLLAKIVDCNGDHVATQRIYITANGGKANVDSPKKAVGKIGGGYIEISNLTGSELAIAEGPETSIAVHLGTGLPTISAISAPNLKNLNIPMGFTTVYIFADLDRSQAGKTAGMGLADRLMASGIKVFLIFPDQELLEDKKSVDFLDVYNCKKDLLKSYLAKTTLWANESVSQKQFVEMRPEALHGVAGKFVERVKPHTEADPNGILAQFLVLIGNIIGRGCCFKIGATSHHLNFFAVIVGDSSKSRKGDGLQMCLYLLKQLDPEWFKTRVIKGLSSGEGVIHAMRDAVFQEEAVTDKSGKIIELKNVEIDPGVKDKRLTAIEGEFVSALKTASRDGNILTAILREAWDGNPLQTLTKTNSEGLGKTKRLLDISGDMPWFS